MSRPSIVPSIDDYRLPKFDFEPWSTSSSVYSQGTAEDEKALIDFNRCGLDIAEDWSSVGQSVQLLYEYKSLTYHEGQEIVRRQHKLPHCS